MINDRYMSGPYTMDSYIRGYNDGFYSGTKRNPYLDVSPEARGYVDGYAAGREDSSVSRFGEVERQKVQVSQRERGLRMSRGQFSMSEGELVDIEPIVNVNLPQKATGQQHEEVRFEAFNMGIDHQSDGSDLGQDLRDQDFDHWMEWVRDEMAPNWLDETEDGRYDLDGFDNPVLQRLAESAQEGYAAGWQHALTPEAPINSDDDINLTATEIERSREWNRGWEECQASDTPCPTADDHDYGGFHDDDKVE